jgi:hypothetical protein
VIAQFPIPTHILAKTNLLEEFTHRPSFMRNSDQERTHKILDRSHRSVWNQSHDLNRITRLHKSNL